jgi:hypothetical protein
MSLLRGKRRARAAKGTALVRVRPDVSRRISCRFPMVRQVVPSSEHDDKTCE